MIDYINWTVVHVMQGAVALFTLINIFLIKKECK